MVCAKCTKALKPTALATPTVKRKSEIYHGSASSSASKSTSTSTTKTSSTLNHAGIGKSKLLSAGAKNPYAIYSSVCTGKECSVKIESGRKYCNKCAYKADACAVCGKANKKVVAGKPVIAGQKFTLK